MQPWDALLDSSPLEMGEDVPFLANQHLALCMRPVLLPGLQLLLSRVKPLVQVFEETQVPLPLCEEPCSHWSACFHVSPWMFKPEFAFSSPTDLPLQWEVLTRGGEGGDNEHMWILLGAKQLVHHLKCCSVFVTSSAMPRTRSGEGWIEPHGLGIMSGSQLILFKEQGRGRASWGVPRFIPTKLLLSFL